MTLKASKNGEGPGSGSIPSKARPASRSKVVQPGEGLDQRFFSVEDVASMLDVCERTVRRWIKRRKLVAHDVEGIIRIAEGDLREFIASSRQL